MVFVSRSCFNYSQITLNTRCNETNGNEERIPKFSFLLVTQQTHVSSTNFILVIWIESIKLHRLIVYNHIYTSLPEFNGNVLKCTDKGFLVISCAPVSRYLSLRGEQAYTINMILLETALGTELGAETMK